MLVGWSFGFRVVAFAVGALGDQAFSFACSSLVGGTYALGVSGLFLLLFLLPFVLRYSILILVTNCFFFVTTVFFLFFFLVTICICIPIFCSYSCYRYYRNELGPNTLGPAVVRCFSLPQRYARVRPAGGLAWISGVQIQGYLDLDLYNETWRT